MTGHNESKKNRRENPNAENQNKKGKKEEKTKVDRQTQGQRVREKQTGRALVTLKGLHRHRSTSEVLHWLPIYARGQTKRET